MNIIIIGYGKMGRTVEKFCNRNGHSVCGHITSRTTPSERSSLYAIADVAIEFSHPDAAFNNIKEALEAGIPTVSGTTGWLTRYSEVEQLVDQKNGAFFYASNFSIGVNLVFALNRKLASLMNEHAEFDVSIDEIHHTKKNDAPSGTAITLAEGIITEIDRKDYWALESNNDNSIVINATRRGEVFGIHQVNYQCETDMIQLRHEALSRDGFAAGAVKAAEWLIGRVGVYSMKDLLEL